MIGESSIDTLVSWRKEALSRLSRVRKEEALIRETFKSSANALRQARYKGKDISWEDRATVLKMLEDIIAGVMQMMTMRSRDLELLLDNIDRLARAELPPGFSWEWPTDRETLEH
jgi:hypothetical protein